MAGGGAQLGERDKNFVLLLLRNNTTVQKLLRKLIILR